MARLVIRPPNWLGDAVMALPAIAALRRHYAHAHLAIAAVPSVAAVFREDTDAAPDEVIDLPASRAAAAPRLAGFDLGILFPNSFGSAWQLRRAGIGARWGYGGLARNLILTRAVARPRGRLHQAEYYRQLVVGLGIACEPAVPRLAPRAGGLAEADRLLARAGVPIAPAQGPLVAFAPGAAYGEAKQWMPDRVAEVAARLIRDRRATCLLLGAGHDRLAGRAIESWFRANAPEAAGRVVNLIGRTALGALIGVISRTAVVVANDSGAMHVAAALGRPVVAVFGPTDDRVTRPVGDHHVLTASVFCRPCMLRDCPIDHRCMKRISTARVYDAVVAVLGPAEVG